MLALAVFVVIGFVALTLPDHPDALTTNAFIKLPLELPIFGLALILLPTALATVLALLGTLAAFVMLFLKLADIGTQAAFQRPFNPYLDLKMIADGWNLASGSIGTPVAVLAVAVILALFFGLMAGFFWSGRMLSRATGAWRRRLKLGFAVLACIGFVGLFSPRHTGPRADLNMAGYLAARLNLVARSVQDMRAFDADLARADGPGEGRGLFAAVAGRDVVLVFVESYGRSAIEDPRYSPLIRPRLERIDAAFQGAGLGAASGWVGSPTVGGLSWLAHGTFLSGLWIDSQARYDLLMASRRLSLNRLFAQAGWQTAAVMPAITMTWPEAAWYGYDQIFAAADLGYRGKPFNWVTMPDQYTLSALDRLVRQPARAAGRPVMAEMALISSHAPWTPVAHMVDWGEIGDGTIFDEQAVAGETPAKVWADPDNVRRHYVETVDYSLEALGDYIARYGRDALFILIGDHQPAAIVTGPDASRDVPVHFVSADRALIARFERFGFKPGMVPPSDAVSRPMSAMRDILIDALGHGSSTSGERP